MKSTMNTLGEKSVEELKGEANRLRKSIAHMAVEEHSNPQKNTNMVFAKRKELARILTIIRQKQLEIK